MTKTIYIFIITTMFFINATAQAPPNNCSSPGASQLDFWLGKWNLTWNDTSKGTNYIEKILGSCVVEENFNDPVGNLVGKSWSMYNPATGLWQQTWVDNQGGYIVLIGRFAENKMTLSTNPVKTADGKTNISRMIFYNITGSNFDWNWEKSTDDGKTWTLNWKIHYRREKE